MKAKRKPGAHEHRSTPEAEIPSDDKNPKGARHEGDEPEDDEDDEDDEGDEEATGRQKESDDEDDEDEDLTRFTPEQTKDYIKRLRRENANYRNKAKTAKAETTSLRQKLGTLDSKVKKAIGIEEEVQPEEKAAQLGEELTQRDFDLAVLEIAYDHGVPKEDREYFSFLIQKEVQSLDDGEELEADRIAEIVAKVKRQGTSGQRGTGTSIPDGKGGTRPKPSDGGDVTIETFAQMTMSQKIELHNKNPELYKKLMHGARDKRLI